MLERSLVVAGNITVDAKGLHDDSADARATATGAKDKENDTSNKNVDKKAEEPVKEAEDKKKKAGTPQKKEIEQPPDSGNVEFATAESAVSELDTDELTLLNNYAAYLKKYPTSIATVSGFTDTVGPFEYNLGLAKKRAETVRQYLIDQQVPANQIRILWYGETNLRELTGNGVNNQKNRRAEVAITAPDATVHEHTPGKTSSASRDDPVCRRR